MRSITRRVIAAAGALAMAGGVMAATAMPASADGVGHTVAYTFQADGDVGFVPPLLLADFPGEGYRQALQLQVFGLAEAQELINKAEFGEASASLGRVHVRAFTGQRALDAQDVTASCGIDDGTAFGDTELFGYIYYNSGIPVLLPAYPDPDTWYHIPGFGAIELNHHRWHNGDLTITAIRAFTHGERISIGVVRCDGEDT
jgi:hypothetical protein